MANKKFTRAICIFLAALMLVSVFAMLAGTNVFAVTQAEIDALEDQRNAIREQQANVQEQIDALETEMASLLERKEALDMQNELLRQEVDLINEQIELYDSMIEQKAEEVEEATALEEEQFRRYRARIRTMEENGTTSYFSFLFKATSLSDLLARLHDIIDIVEYDKNLKDEYTAARENVEKVKAEYEEVQEEQEEKKAELLIEKGKLEEQIEEAYTLFIELEKDLEAYEIVYEENILLEIEVQNKIDELAAELKKQEEEEERRRQEQLAQQQQQNNSGSSGNSYVVGGSYTWPTPSSAYITSRFGSRLHPVLGTWRNHYGVDVAAYAGSQILAAQGGTVAVAEYSSSYGYYVVIYHSSGVTTLYAHMSSMAVSAGQTVSQGQVIGYVGSTGLSTGPHLHFEVRVNGACVDPLSYYPNISFSFSPDA